MLNHIEIMGRLVREPEVRYTQSQVPVASFTVAVERDFGRDTNGDRQTDFIDCVAWRQTAEFVSKYFRKGSLAVVTGRLQQRPWEDRDGHKRTSWEINVENMYFGESRKDGNTFPANPQSAAQGPQGRNEAPVVPDNVWGSVTPDEDAELPF